MAKGPPVLLTFAPMVDSETARLILRYHRVEYRESDRLFGWVSLLTFLHGGYGRVPILHGNDPWLTGPRKIAELYDAKVPSGRRLIPVEWPHRGQVEHDWRRYNGRMAVDTAVLAYFHLLPERGLMLPIFAAPVPPGEARLLPALYGPTALLFRLLLRLSPQRAAGAAVRIRQLFDWTDQRIADGRPYLAGDRMTLSDLSLMAASAPLLLPDGYGATLPPIEQMPATLRDFMMELRNHPTSAFVQRLYSAMGEGEYR